MAADIEINLSLSWSDFRQLLHRRNIQFTLQNSGWPEIGKWWLMPSYCVDVLVRPLVSSGSLECDEVRRLVSDSHISNKEQQCYRIEVLIRLNPDYNIGLERSSGM